MKKLYLIIAVLIPSSGIFSQTKYIGNQANTISGLTILGRSIGNNCAQKDVSCIQQLWADPWLNDIVLVRAHDTTTGNGIYYDFSKDGGFSWTVDYAYPYDCLNDQAQYPSAGIINPSGVLNPDSAYVTFRTRTVHSDEIINGQHQVASGIAINTANQPLYEPIPNDYTITRQGIIWETELPFDSIYYQNKIIVRRGEWSNLMHAVLFTTDTIPFPMIAIPNGIVSIVSTNIAFAPDGQTGYIVVSGNNGTYTDSVYYPIVIKTTDGGVTWGAPVAINLSGLDNFFQLGNTAYTLFEHCDALVDANGELHIAATVLKHAAAWSVYLNPSYGTFGIFDIYSSGPDWEGRMISFPNTFADQVGIVFILRQYNRPQISMDSSATKLFFVWAETDTLMFGVYENEYPDIWMRGYDINTGLCTPSINVTTGTVAFGNSRFHQVSNYCMTGDSIYTIPVVISLFDDMAQGPASGVTFNYLNDNNVNWSAFTDACSSVTLTATVSISSPQKENHDCSIIAVNTYDKKVELRINKSWQLLRVMSIEGKEMLVKSSINSNYTISRDLLSTGVYIYQLFGSDGEVCTGKFLIE